MPADFTMSFSEAFLNKACGQVFPALASKLTQTERVPDQNLTLSWAITAPPQFVLTGQDGPQMFKLILQLQVSITPDGQPTDTGTDTGTATVLASIDGAGHLHLRVNALSFAGSDPFLTAVLNQKEADVADQVNQFLATISPSLSIINGITFGSYAIAFGPGAGAMAASLGPTTSVGAVTAPATDFALTIGQPLVHQIVQQSFWNTVPKTYDASGAHISLNGYDVGLANGQVQLTLYLGGSYSVAGADWDVRIDPVVSTLNVSVDASNNVVSKSGGTSTPGVSMHPSNWLAWIYTIGAAVITAITQAIISSVIGDKIQGTINGQLDRTLLQVPVLSGSFSGVTITLTPGNLTVGGAGNQLVIAGNGTATAS